MMTKKRIELVREFATIMAGYSTLLPAIEPLLDDDLTNLEPLEIESIAVCRRIQKLVRGNLRPWQWSRLGAPDHFKKRNVPEHIMRQYSKGLFAPTPILLDAQIVAEKGIQAASGTTINNFTCGISVFTCYIDHRGSFKNFPVVTLGFLNEAADEVFEGLMAANGMDRNEAKKRIKDSIEVADMMVRKILKSRSDK